MTLVAAWTRKVKDYEELIFVSDSRICGGQRWDECPKLTTMPGNRNVLAFAGDADYAYPMMMQLNMAMTGYRRIEDGSIELSELNGYILKHANMLIGSVYDMANPEYVPEVEFLFGGYSWKEKCFKLWKYYYVKFDKGFRKDGKTHELRPGIKGNFMAIGDQKEIYKKELVNLLIERYGEEAIRQKKVVLDMEPFEALCRMLKKSGRRDSIGGAPQMIKSRQFMNCCPVGVYWPERIDDYTNRTLLGRRLLDSEETDYYFIDPKSLKIYPCLRR